MVVVVATTGDMRDTVGNRDGQMRSQSLEDSLSLKRVGTLEGVVEGEIQRERPALLNYERSITSHGLVPSLVIGDDPSKHRNHFNLSEPDCCACREQSAQCKEA